MTEAARATTLYYLRCMFKNGQQNLLAWRGNVAWQKAREAIEEARLEVADLDKDDRHEAALVALADDFGNFWQIDVRELQNVIANDSHSIAVLSNAMQFETWRGQVALEEAFNADPIKGQFMQAQERAMRRAQLMAGTVQAQVPT